MGRAHGDARARACANIALAKYWGKSDRRLNLPAVPSISMTLDRLVTETRVTFDAGLDADEVTLDGDAAGDREARRVVDVLDRVRASAGIAHRARVTSDNRFPTAAGLASSASGFAALAAAATVAAGMPYRPKQISRLARQASASAARSVWGGFVELPAGTTGDDSLCARPLHGPDHWEVALVIALAARGPKEVGSTEGMERSRETSPYYEAWVEAAPRLAREVRLGLRARDLDRVGRAMEQSTMAFHACAMASSPAIVYWQPPTLAILREVRRLREERGIAVYATMDAGPHVKALCHADDARRVRAALGKVDGVVGTRVARPGPDLEVAS